MVDGWCAIQTTLDKSESARMWWKDDIQSKVHWHMDTFEKEILSKGNKARR